MEFFGHRRAADDRTALEHRNRKACLGQIAGTYEPIVAAADDDGVEASGGHRHPVVPAGAASPCSRTMADPGKDQTQRNVVLLLLVHACGDRRKSAIGIGNFAGDGTGQVGK